MDYYLLKKYNNGFEKRMYVGTKKGFTCPDRNDDKGWSHDFKYQGQYYTEMLKDTRKEVEGGFIDTTITFFGKVGDKHIPKCKCGKRLVELGYMVSIIKENHSKEAYRLQIARYAGDDKKILLRYFKKRKARDKFKNRILNKEG